MEIFLIPDKTKKILLDIMLNDRFVCQLAYPVAAGEKIVDIKDLEWFVTFKRPSLNGKKFNINFSEQKV